MRKASRLRSYIFRGLIGLILLCLLSIIAGYLYLRQSLPQIEGSVIVSGINEPIEIIRDASGVPHIFAKTDQDAFFAQGYVHAQDRMWQLELQRRVGAGRLSEMFGGQSLETDKFLRTLGVYRAAKAAWPALSEKSQLALTAYAAGVNAWLAEDHLLPVEFLILGVEPEPWTVTDSLVWSKMMAWDLGGNYRLELLRLRLIQAIGPERTAQLIPTYPDDGTTILADNHVSPHLLDTLLSLDGALQHLYQLGGIHVGSNSWVIDGTLTESGAPLLANDPHLGTRVPSVWYLLELQGDDIHVMGASLPGLPGLVIGHNESIAWGVTNLAPDVQDLYIERVNPENPNQVEANGQWIDLTAIEEPIFIKDQVEPLRWAARSSRHGPLISDVSSRAPFALSFRWTALDPGDTTMDSFLNVNYAQNWDEFVQAMQAYVAPSQNFVYADREGNIGYFGPGHIPIRAKGNGMVPAPGWDNDHQWQDWIPFSELPQAYNPDSHFIVTANNRVVSDDYPYFITNDWSPPYRAQRITDLIQSKQADGQKLSVEDMIAIQLDQTSTQAQQLLPHLQNLEPETERQAEALAYLTDWSGDTDRNSIAATLYQAWFVHVGRAIFEDDLPGSLYEEVADRKHPIFLNNIFNQPDNIWCDNVHTFPKESCDDIALQALGAALDDLTDRLGDDMGQWQWGKVHQTQYPHTPFSEVPALKWLFHRRIENGGDTYTPNVAAVRFADLYHQYHVPSYRHVINLASFETNVYMHTTGQSGNILSPHYDDLIEPHRDGHYLSLSFGRGNAQGVLLTLENK